MPTPCDMPLESAIPLALLARGQRGEVSELVGAADHVHRLEELGLRRGSLVEMLQAGSPCIVRLAGNKLCIRDADLFGVLVVRRDVA